MTAQTLSRPSPSMFATATMDPFSSSPVMDGGFIGKPFGSPSVSRNTSPVASPSKTELDDDFPMDMDESFNSSMSFSFNSTQESPLQAAGKRTGVFGLTTRAPLGQTKSFQTVFDSKDSMAPQRRLGPHRTFGQELTNIASGPSRSTLFTKPKSKGRMLPPALPETPAKGISPAPLKSTLSQENVGTPRFVLPRMGRRESAPAIESPARPAPDAMDVDSPAPSIGGDLDLGEFFEASPAQSMVPSKRNFAAHSSPGSPASDSPSIRRCGHDRSTSMGGLTFNRAATIGARREVRRPLLPSLASCQGRLPSNSMSSAGPIMSGARPLPFKGMNRTFSLMQETDDDTDMDASPLANDQRRYGRLSRPALDGSPSVKPIRTAVPRAACAIKTAVEGPCTAELPLHGVEERHNKILPCHIVKEDGLVRITPETMTDVLAGRYNDRIGRYHVFDCRFDYEFEGGHIDGATNVSSLEHLDELLLRAFSGLNERCALPQPSASGQLETSQQVVLIFHCEFSQKRAPTFAKELRTRDRSMNLASYPKVHYPEIYILEGGYKNFYEHAPHKCEPCAYVPMTHPTHMKRCRSDMAKFERNFGRTRSFAAIESQLSSSRLAPPIALAAGTAAQGRRGNRAVRPAIAEENELDSSPLARRAQSMGQAPMLSSRALQRCATAAEFLRRL